MAHSAGSKNISFQGLFGLVDDDCVIHYERPHDFRRKGLRIPEIDHFVNNFIDQNEVFSYGFFSKDSTEVFDNFDQRLQNFDDVRSAHVDVCGDYEVEVVFLYVNKVDAFQKEDRGSISFSELHCPEKRISCFPLYFSSD